MRAECYDENDEHHDERARSEREWMPIDMGAAARISCRDGRFHWANVDGVSWHSAKIEYERFTRCPGKQILTHWVEGSYEWHVNEAKGGKEVHIGEIVVDHSW